MDWVYVFFHIWVVGLVKVDLICFFLFVAGFDMFVRPFNWTGSYFSPH